MTPQYRHRFCELAVVRERHAAFGSHAPRRRQNGEPECQGTSAVLAFQRQHERCDVGPRERGVVLHRCHLGSGRQQIGQVPAPAGRVLARPVAARLCPIEDGFEAAAKAALKLLDSFLDAVDATVSTVEKTARRYGSQIT